MTPEEQCKVRRVVRMLEGRPRFELVPYGPPYYILDNDAWEPLPERPRELRRDAENLCQYLNDREAAGQLRPAPDL